MGKPYTRVKEGNNRPQWANRIRGTISERGLSLKYVAEELGINPVYFRNVLRGQYDLPLTDFKEKVCNYLEIEIDEEEAI